MTKTEYHFHNNELRDKLLPKLLEKVFHVTSYDRFEMIEKSEMIKSNADGKFGYTYKVSENSYGRKRGYICLFDLRKKTDEEIQHGLDDFYFLGNRKLGNKQVFFVLKENRYSKLIHTDQAKAEIRFKETWIPYVECWYPKDLPLSNIQELLVINIKRDPGIEALAKSMKEAIPKNELE